MLTVVKRADGRYTVQAPWTSTLPAGVRADRDIWQQVERTFQEWSADVVYGTLKNQNPHGPLRVVRDGCSGILREKHRYPIELFTNGSRVHDELCIAILGNHGQDASKQAHNASLLSGVPVKLVRGRLPSADDAEFRQALVALFKSHVKYEKNEIISEPYITALMEDCPMVQPPEVAKFLRDFPMIRAVHIHKIGDRARDWEDAARRPAGENGWTFAGGLAKLRVANNGAKIFTIKDRDHTGGGPPVENAYVGFVDWLAVDPQVLKTVHLHPPDKGKLARHVVCASLPQPLPFNGIQPEEMAQIIIEQVVASRDNISSFDNAVAGLQDAPAIEPEENDRGEAQFVTPLGIRLPNLYTVNRNLGSGVPELSIAVDAALKFKISQVASLSNPDAAIAPMLRHLSVSDAGLDWATKPEVTPAMIRSVAGDIVSQMNTEMRLARRDARDYHSNRAVQRYKLGILGPGASRTWGEVFGDLLLATGEVTYSLASRIGLTTSNSIGAMAMEYGSRVSMNKHDYVPPALDLSHPGPNCPHTLGSMFGNRLRALDCVAVIGSRSIPADAAPLPEGVKIYENPLADHHGESKCVGIRFGANVTQEVALCDVRSFDAVISSIRKSVATPPVPGSFIELGLEHDDQSVWETLLVGRVIQGVGVLGRPWASDRDDLSKDDFLKQLRKATLRVKHAQGEELFYSGVDDFDPQTGQMRSAILPKFERKKPVADGCAQKEDRMIANVTPVDFFRSAEINCTAANIIVVVGGIPPRAERSDKSYAVKKARDAWGDGAAYSKKPLDEAGADSARNVSHFRMYAIFLLACGAIDPGHPYYSWLTKIRSTKLHHVLLKAVVDHAHLLSGHSGTWSIQTFMRLVFAVLHMEIVCGFKKEEYAVAASGDDMVLMALDSASLVRKDRHGRAWHSDESIKRTGAALCMKMTSEGPLAPIGEPAKFLGGDDIETASFPRAPDTVINITDFDRAMVSLGVVPVIQWDAASLKGRLTHMRQAWLDRFNLPEFGVCYPVLGPLARFNYARAGFLLANSPGRVGAMRDIGDELWSRVDSYKPVARWYATPGVDHWLRHVCEAVWGIDIPTQVALESTLAGLEVDRDHDLVEAWGTLLACRAVRA